MKGWGLVWETKVMAKGTKKRKYTQHLADWPEKLKVVIRDKKIQEDDR